MRTLEKKAQDHLTKNSVSIIDTFSSERVSIVIGRHPTDAHYRCIVYALTVDGRTGWKYFPWKNKVPEKITGIFESEKSIIVMIDSGNKQSTIEIYF